MSEDAPTIIVPPQPREAYDPHDDLVTVDGPQTLPPPRMTANEAMQLDAKQQPVNRGKFEVVSMTGGDERLKQRYERLFAPITTVSEPETTDDNDGSEYDHLFADEEPEYKPVWELGIKQDKGRNHITPESEEYARTQVLSRFDNERSLTGSPVAQLIRGYLKEGEGVGSDHALVELRTNPELRVALGTLFMDRQLRLEHMLPSRIRNNGDKSSVVPGYNDVFGRLSSREYVAMLALAMLDGSFDATSYDYDPIKIDDNGEVEYGQHRAAAHEVLFW